MPEVLEPTTQTSAIPPQLARYVWNSAQASAAARRKHELARIRKGSCAIPQTQPEQPAPDERLQLLSEQIARTRMTLNGKLEPQHRAALLRALCDLLDQQRIARGEPLPGSRKPAPERRQVNDVPLQPKPTCGPDTTTNSVNQQQPVNETPQGNSSQ